MSRRAVRLLVVPAILFVVVTGTVFTLAVLHPARAERTAAAGSVALGDQYRGETLFLQKCASCHGEGGRKGTVGPTLAGSPISLADAQARIENGGGVMPAGLVSGEDLEDVLAYLEDVLAR